MKPVFKVTSPKTPNRSYEYVELDGSQLCELEDSKVVLTTVKNGLTSQTKVGLFKVLTTVRSGLTNQINVGLSEDVFVIQRAQEQFGGAVKFTEAILENIVDCKFYGEVAEYMATVIEALCPMEINSEINCYQTSINYSGRDYDVWYSGVNKEVIWISFKSMRGEKFEVAKPKDLFA